MTKLALLAFALAFSQFASADLVCKNSAGSFRVTGAEQDGQPGILTIESISLGVPKHYNLTLDVVRGACSKFVYRHGKSTYYAVAIRTTKPHSSLSVSFNCPGPVTQASLIGEDDSGFSAYSGYTCTEEAN